MRLTTIEILNDIEELFNCDVKEHVLKYAIQNIPNYPVQLLIDSINEELKRLHMPYLIKDLTKSNEESFIWIVDWNLHPTQLNWGETVRLDERGEAVYQTLLEPFKNSNVIFPTSLRSAMELFKLDPSDDWNLGTYRDWLVGINASFYPHECKDIIQKLMALTVKA